MTREFKVLHLFAGLGGAALGFKQATEEYRGVVGRFRTLAGIDVDAEACQDFRMLTGAPAVCLDLFSRGDYVAFHGHQPPADWYEATPEDLVEATGGEYPDAVFLSPPCKGFSGLLPADKAASDKYQALNRLVIRGLDLALQAFEDDLPAVFLLENVPRITSRGEWLLRQVKKLLATHGYVFDEGYHDCGELGGLAQHRRRYLLIARQRDKMSAFIYRPPVQRVRAIGEVLGELPMPDNPAAGPMHRLPRLQWRTWVRLALIPAGGDWRDLECLAGKEWHPNAYRIIPWGESAGTITSGGAPSCGAVTVADPRLGHSPRNGVFGVSRWDEAATTVVGSARVGGSNGFAAVADPRLAPGLGRNFKGSPGLMSVQAWDQPSRAVVGLTTVTSGNGPGAVADPRIPVPGAFHNQYRVVRWDEPTDAVTGMRAVADPRLGCQPRSGSYGVLAWDKPASTVTGAGDIHAGAAAVADPRIPADDERPDPPPVIVALDGTWHRPLTTLELAALQGFPTTLPDGRPLILAGKSDARWRERIGNAVPPPAARAIAEQVLLALLASERREWTLGSTGIWVRQGGDDATCPAPGPSRDVRGREAVCPA